MERSCKNCGLKVNNQVKYCPQCGEEVAFPPQPLFESPQFESYQMESQLQPQTQQQFPPEFQAIPQPQYPLNPYLSPRPINAFEMDIQFYVQDNEEYYIKKIRTMKMNRQTSSWNWVAFFFPMYWALYRKMYPLGAALFGVSLITRFIPFVGGLISLGVSIYMGIMGNHLYTQQMEKVFIEASHLGLTGNERMTFLNKRGGTNGTIVLILIFISVIMYFVFLAGMVNEFSDMMQY